MFASLTCHGLSALYRRPIFLQGDLSSRDVTALVGHHEEQSFWRRVSAEWEAGAVLSHHQVTAVRERWEVSSLVRAVLTG